MDSPEVLLASSRAIRSAHDGNAERVQFPMGEPSKDSQLQYLNNIVEQDHRRVKFRVGASRPC